MSGMGDDFGGGSPAEPLTPAEREEVIRAAMIRAAIHTARGLTPAEACGVGCKVCGVLDASPSRCEYCAHGVGFQRPAWLDTQPAVHHVDACRPFTGRAPGMLQDDDRGLSRWLASTPEAMRCARDAALNIEADSEGGECA